MKELLKDISFKEDDGKLAEMFSDIAEKVAEKLENDYIRINNKNERSRRTSTTQFRQFYEKILELNDKAQGNKKFKTSIFPFVKLLKSKVQYSLSRGNCGLNFVDMMNISIDKVESAEELQNFKYFLEAVIGYMPKK